MDGSGQSHATEVSKNTLDPKWNVHYDLYVGVNDAITISVWNDKKVCTLYICTRQEQWNFLFFFINNKPLN